MPGAAERPKQQVERDVYATGLHNFTRSMVTLWPRALHSVRNPENNSRPPCSRRQSTSRFHICNRLHCPTQGKFVPCPRARCSRVSIVNSNVAGARHGARLRNHVLPNRRVAVRSHGAMAPRRTNRRAQGPRQPAPFVGDGPRTGTRSCIISSTACAAPDCLASGSTCPSTAPNDRQRHVRPTCGLSVFRNCSLPVASV